MSKERVTILSRANMSNTEKRSILLIRISPKLRCLKNVKNLPVQYKSNKKDWMTLQIFADWVTTVNKRLRLQKIIVLFIDNCTAHKNLPDFNSLKIVFLPLNTTSEL